MDDKFNLDGHKGPWIYNNYTNSNLEKRLINIIMEIKEWATNTKNYTVCDFIKTELTQLEKDFPYRASGDLDYLFKGDV